MPVSISVCNAHISLFCRFYKLDGLVYRPRKHRFIADLDDRPLQNGRVRYDQPDYLIRRRVRRNVQLLECGITSPEQSIRLDPDLLNQIAELIRGQRIVKIIYLLIIDAVFTKQLGQISARRSGRFFINYYLFAHN
jgi:hypothetical protein